MITKVVPLGDGLVAVHFDSGSSVVVQDDGSFIEWTGEKQ